MRRRILDFFRGLAGSLEVKLGGRDLFLCFQIRNIGNQMAMFPLQIVNPSSGSLKQNLGLAHGRFAFDNVGLQLRQIAFFSVIVVFFFGTKK
jgi:hypothetical protein